MFQGALAIKRIPSLAFVFGILFLFLIQSAGTLVESIYILDLLNTNLDEKALGVLFFFTPLLMLPFYKKSPRLLGWLLFGALVIARGLMPFLSTSDRMLAAGIATGAAFSLFLLLLAARVKDEARPAIGLWGSAGLSLAVGLSTLLRTVYFGVDYSLIPAGGWVGPVLGIVLGGLLTQVDLENKPAVHSPNEKATTPIVGIYLLIALVYFVFSAPAVIARWTEGNYPLIVSAVSLLSLAWVWIAFFRPRLLNQISPPLLLAWNIIFTLSLTGTILAHRVSFPPTLDSPEVVVGAPTLWQQLPLGFMLLLFPVIFVDLRIFLNQVERIPLSPRRLVPGILAGSFALILLIFAHIFTNVWGYVEPVSLPFRNAFWLPHFLITAGITLIVWRVLKGNPDPASLSTRSFHWSWGVVLGAFFLVTAVTSLPGPRAQDMSAGKTSLVAMTYNTQQFNDDPGEKSFDRQIDLIRRASPDILAMQETDSNRISLNNNDYVRYFAERLGYYAYYGPTPITGTFGTAILSKYPLENTRTVFIFSDKDETGVAEAEVVIGERRFTIYNIHPDSSDPAMMKVAETLLARSQDQENVIILGDYNLRDFEEAYQLIDSVYTNAWVSVYPDKIGADGLDMSGKNRIDHIFFSAHLKARDPVYILPPESATDHPVHWTELYWQNP